MAAFPSSQPFISPPAHPYGYQGDERSSSASGNTASSVTLLIRHLPEAIPQETLSRLLSHYGASSVRPCTSGKLKNCAFVDFINEQLAYQAQRSLNGLMFLGKVLKVERASNSVKLNEVQERDAQSANEMHGATSGDSTTNLKSSSVSAEPIAPKLGIEYPFPPHLEYVYPPPDGNILTNIVNALIAVPRFYTQVLHLMNKMNIPAPFRMALPTPPLPPSAPQPPPPPPPIPAPDAAKPPKEDLSESESEMESSEEEIDEKATLSMSSRGKGSGRKRARTESILGPAVNKDITHEAVGVKPAALLPKEIPMIKKNNPVLQIKIAPKRMKGEEKDDTDARDEDVMEKEKSIVESFARPEDLEKGKMPMEEILSLPQFKNYTPGNPAPVLYIKNLAKDVVRDDFDFIFGSLFGSTDEARSKLSVKLMQEGRMRGQAFVTFPSVELAQTALNLVNGYFFKGKPMIIQFGRNAPAAAKANSSDAT